jgi:hypothetical protein
MILLTVPEVRRLLRACGEAPAQFTFHLEWSLWRRQHQAAAQRAHIARRHRRLANSPAPQSAPLPPAGVPTPPRVQATLTEDEWLRVLPLLPPEKPARGRTAHPHRPLVTAMVWVERTGASWRQVPPEVGPWHRVYNRYRRWRATGLWARITAALAPSASGPSQNLPLQAA